MDKVPWVALWTSESKNMKSIPYGPKGIIGKKDSHGIYWAEYGTSPGVGEPLFGMIHTRRQVESMRTPKCQVCGENLIRPFYWILNKLDSMLLDKKTIFTQTPPVCRRCVDVSIELCPHLKSMDNVPVLEVAQYSCVGAYGDLLLPGQKPKKHHAIKYGDPTIPYFCGRQLIVELQKWKKL